MKNKVYITMTQRTNEALWQRIKNKVTSQAVAGTEAGKWSARKAQMCVRMYKEEGGGYKGAKKSDNSLTQWSKQEWTTKSGKPSSQTGERYLPKKAIASLTDKEYKRTTEAKRKDKKAGKTVSKQPKDVAEKTKKYR